MTTFAYLMSDQEWAELRQAVATNVPKSATAAQQIHAASVPAPRTSPESVERRRARRYWTRTVVTDRPARRYWTRKPNRPTSTTD